MTYTNTQIAKQIASLLNKNKTPIFQKGNTSSTGINKEITVRLTNGKVVRALAWNVSTPGQVTVFWDAQNKRYIAWKESVSSLKRRTVLANRKTRPDDKKYLWEYCVKILQTSSIEGFDNDVTLNLTDHIPVAITNTGTGYVVVLRRDNDYIFVVNNTIVTKELVDFSYIGSDLFYKIEEITPDYTTTTTTITVPSGSGFSPSVGKGLLESFNLGSNNQTITYSGDNYNAVISLETYNRIYVNGTSVVYAGAFDFNDYNRYQPSPYTPLIPNPPEPTVGGNGWTLYADVGFGESYTQNVSRTIPYKKKSYVDSSISQDITESETITIKSSGADISTDITKRTIEESTYTKDSELNSSTTESWIGLYYYQFTSGATSISFIALTDKTGTGTGFNTENGNLNRQIIESGSYPLILDNTEKTHNKKTLITESITIDESSTITMSSETVPYDFNFINLGLQSVVSMINQENTNSISAESEHTEEIEEFYTEEYILFNGSNGIYSRVNNKKSTFTTKNIADDQSFTILDGSIIISPHTFTVTYYDLIWKELKNEDITTTGGGIRARYLSEFNSKALNTTVITDFLLDYLKYYVCVQIGNTTYKIKDYPGDYKNHFFFRTNPTSLTTGETVTLTRDGYDGFRVGLNDMNEFYYKRNPKKTTYNYVRNAEGETITDTTVYEYYNDDFYTPSTDCFVYQITNGVCTKWNATLQSFGYANSYSFDDGENEYRNFDKITITINEEVSNDFYLWSNVYTNTIIVETSDNSTLSLLTYLRDFNRKDSVNLYSVLNENGGETVELSIAEIPTTTTPETLRADIYRFNTTSLKWERRPNAITPVSPLTEVSDFVSYHPTPSNSKKKKKRFKSQ